MKLESKLGQALGLIFFMEVLFGMFGFHFAKDPMGMYADTLHIGFIALFSAFLAWKAESRFWPAKDRTIMTCITAAGASFVAMVNLPISELTAVANTVYVMAAFWLCGAFDEHVS